MDIGGSWSTQRISTIYLVLQFLQGSFVFDRDRAANEFLLQRSGQLVDLFEQRFAYQIFVLGVGRQRRGCTLPDGNLVADLLDILRFAKPQIADRLELHAQLEVRRDHYDRDRDCHVQREGGEIDSLK